MRTPATKYIEIFLKNRKKNSVLISIEVTHALSERLFITTPYREVACFAEDHIEPNIQDRHKQLYRAVLPHLDVHISNNTNVNEK